MKVFFSHCGRDKALVRGIFPYLPEHVRKWYDESDLKWGEDVNEGLRKAILDDVDFVVIFLSREALKSKWVIKELNWALEKEEELGRIFALPVLLEEGVWDKVEPEHFKNRKHLKFFDQTQANTMALASELTNQLFAWLSEILEKSKREKKQTALRPLKDKLPENIAITTSATSFIQSIDFSRVSQVLLIAHTGRRIFHDLQAALDEFLDRGQVNPELEIKILLRNPYAENQDRYGHIYNSVRLLKRLRTRGNINIDIRYYQSLPVFRAIFCCYPGTDARKSIVSTYKWLPRFRSRAFEQLVRIDDSTSVEGGHPINQMVLSWFEHYWGVKEIHTVVFDFDDTITNTMEIQVDSWVTVVLEKASTGKAKTYLAPDIAAALGENDPDNLKGIIKKIFLDKQMAPQIFSTIFPDFPESEKELKDEINDLRFEIREELTRQRTTLFDKAEEVLERLHRQYQLAIISSTSESLIQDILSQFKILRFFSTILGKYGPKAKWEHINDKAHQLIRLSNLTGIPLDRTVFIGDNNSDFKSARQLGVKFIEARMVAEKEKESLGKETLIDYPENDVQRYFTSYGDGTLEEFLEEMNGQLSRDKYKLDQKFLA